MRRLLTVVFCCFGTLFAEQNDAEVEEIAVMMTRTDGLPDDI
jgi:hypothetical protein